MTSQRTRRLLLIAFCVSLLIHVVIALRVEWPFAPPKEEVETVRIERARAIRVSRLPTPPPSTPPPATPSPGPSATASAPAPTKAPAPGAGTGRSKPGGGTTPPRTPLPTVAASATPNCATTDTPVTLASTPAPPDIAATARGSATNGVTRVRVAIDANGVVTSATVAQSSGNPSLDLVAVSMARGAHYNPAMHGCKPIASEYVFSAKFVAW